jgi:hypothetical protein
MAPLNSEAQTPFPLQEEHCKSHSWHLRRLIETTRWTSTASIHSLIVILSWSSLSIPGMNCTGESLYLDPLLCGETCELANFWYKSHASKEQSTTHIEARLHTVRYFATLLFTLLKT